MKILNHVKVCFVLFKGAPVVDDTAINVVFCLRFSVSVRYYLRLRDGVSRGPHPLRPQIMVFW